MKNQDLTLNNARVLTSGGSEAVLESPALPGWGLFRSLLAKLRLTELSRFLGPAFIVSVAYIDPGNFATNITGGSAFNYDLVWVILWSNLTAIFVQIMSAKLGIATGKSLPEVCQDQFSRPTNWFLWIVAEVSAMATDLAEFLGGTLGFYLLFRIPMIWAGLLTGVVSMVIVSLDRYGQRAVEWVITALVGVISLAYFIELFLAGPDWGLVAYHTLVPKLTDKSVLVAVGMLGATVMPHVIYLHSQLVQSRRDGLSLTARKRHLKMEKIDVFVAMNIAFLINAAMVVVAAAVFFKRGMIVDSIEQAHMSLTPLLGSLSSGAFAIALLASGLSSAAVGTMAGQVIMNGFTGFRIPIWVRRLVTMLPALIVIALQLNPVRVLVISQVLLSFTLPAAIIPMMLATSDRRLMGDFVNSRLTSALGWVIVSAIVSLNVLLIFMILTGRA
ncbi:MAG: Nramp family divalent metal transporter [Symbiobacteriia bacterium]